MTPLGVRQATTAIGLLSNATRRTLVDLVRAEPGIHLRAAQRRLGVSWGTFSFHLHALEGAGLLRRAEAGGYVTLHVSRPPPGAWIRGTTAERVLRALPAEGSPRELRELRDELGLTRQLLLYHARRLEAAQLVTVTPGRTSLAVARAVAQSPHPITPSGPGRTAGRQPCGPSPSP